MLLYLIIVLSFVAGLALAFWKFTSQEDETVPAGTRKLPGPKGIIRLSLCLLSYPLTLALPQRSARHWISTSIKTAEPLDVLS